VRASDGTPWTLREALLYRVTATAIRPTLSGDLPLPAARRAQELLARSVPVRARTEVRHGRIAGVGVEVVRPRTGGTDGNVVLYVHGGGFVMGSPRTHRMVTAALAHEAAATVVVPDYRLAPEHPFPAAVDDVRAVYDALVAARDPDRLTVAGDSAGGNLVLGLTVGLAGRGGRIPDAVAAISPFTDPTMGEGGSWDTSRDAMLTRRGGEAFTAAYLSDGDRDDARVAVHLGDLGALPPTLVQVGGAEALRDDSVRFAVAAARAGAPVHVQEWPGMWHVHQVLTGLLPAADRAVADLATFLLDGTLPAGGQPAATFGASRSDVEVPGRPAPDRGAIVPRTTAHQPDEGAVTRRADA
jgi:epsilon-lactone hydrolase